MNTDAIKKALGYCAGDSIDDCKACPYADNGPFACSISMYKDALNLITEQEKEIERLKDENKENCWKCIEAKRVTEEDYAKLQELFTQYQMASDKEIKAQVKQAKIDVLNELRARLYVIYGTNTADLYYVYGTNRLPLGNKTAEDIVENIDELIKEVKK